MKIGIIGAGNIGSVLALRFVEHGHEVRIGNSRGPGTLGDVERETGAKPCRTQGRGEGRRGDRRDDS